MNTKLTIDCSRRNESTVVTEEDYKSMKTVKEVCEIAGITRKTLFYYDKIGLLKPTARIGNQKHKLYSDKALRRLLQIRIYRKAGLDIREIKQLLQGAESMEILQVVRQRHCEQQIRLHQQMQILNCICKRKLETMTEEELFKLLWE